MPVAEKLQRILRKISTFTCSIRLLINPTPMNNFLKNTLILACAAGALYACDKTEDKIDNPLLIVTPTEGTSAPAGKRIDFDIDATDADNLTRITVDVQENSDPSVKYLDSTFNPAKLHIVFALQYDLPVNAVKGDQFHFTFTAYDALGNSSTSTKSITVSGSRPKVEINAPVTDVNAGETVNFSVTFSDPGSDLKSFRWVERINADTDTELRDSTFNAGVRNVTIPFSYQVPADLQPGEFSVMLLEATNQDNVTWGETKRFTVK